MESSGKRAFSTVEAVHHAHETKCAKRRRRSPSLVTLGYGEKQHPQVFQLDQMPSGATTTTTTKRSSRFRGVSRHRWTGRFEAHLWDKGTWNPTQKKKGKQVYLGAYDEEEAAARAYDLAAIKYWGTTTYTNFPISDYEKEIEIMQSVTREEYLASLRRRSSGFARGVSKYRGVARHHHNGRWEARIGRVFGNKYLYLGTYGTQEEAAHAYDIAAIEYRGINAVTNFDLSTYIRWLRPTADDHSSSLAEYELGLTSGNNALVEQPDLTYAMSPNRKVNSPNSNSYAVSNPAISQKHEIIERKMPLSPSNRATFPTALGLLHRSPLFNQMVQKTATSAADQEKRVNKTRQDGEFMFYPANDCCQREVAYAVNGEKVMPKGDANALSLYNQNGQRFWNAMQNGQ